MWGALLVAPIVSASPRSSTIPGCEHAGLRVLPGRHLVHPAGAAPGLDRGRAVGGQHLHERAVRWFQYAVGGIQHLPLLLFPSLNSTGAEVGKPVAPQTTSVEVSTSSYVRREGEVIRHNFGWTLVILGYLILIGLFYYFVLPEAMRL
jgi:lactate permease